MLWWIWGCLSLLGHVAVGTVGEMKMGSVPIAIYQNNYKCLNDGTLEMTCFWLQLGIELQRVCPVLTPNFNKSFQDSQRQRRSAHLAIFRVNVNSLVIPDMPRIKCENNHNYVTLHYIHLDLECIHFLRTRRNGQSPFPALYFVDAFWAHLSPIFFYLPIFKDVEEIDLPLGRVCVFCFTL